MLGQHTGYFKTVFLSLIMFSKQTKKILKNPEEKLYTKQK
jgi:hypothetical protein